MPRLSWFKSLYRSKASISATLTIVLSFVLVVSFQNCGKAGFDGTQSAVTASSNPASNAPFAYEASVDMITYNSCNSPSSQGKTYNFMIGSYDSKVSAGANVGSAPVVNPKSGVRVRQDFINYAYEVLKPDYPNPDITAEQVQKLLAESELNNKVYPQLSVRSINKGLRLNNVFSKTNAPALGLDVIQVLGDMANATWANLLLSKAFPKKSKIEYTDYFGTAANAQSRIESAFHFNTNEQTAEDYRNAFNKIGNIDAQLVLGFSYEGQGLLITPNDSSTDVMTSAYGRGYQMTFTIPTAYGQTPSSWAYHPNNVVSSITETDLTNNQAISDAVWDCGLRLRIVRQEDSHFEWATLVAAIDQAVTTDANIPAETKAAKKEEIIAANAVYYGRGAGELVAGFCPKMDYMTLMSVPPQTSVYGTGAYAGKTYAEILEMVRRHLPANEWDINLMVGCIVPKKFTCYPENERKPTDDGSYYGRYRVANAVNKGCFHQFDGSYYKANQKYNNVLPTEWCNEYATVCTKR